MKKILLGTAAAALMSFTSFAEEVLLEPDHPDNYNVVKGDTLWGISDRFLQNPWMWPEIWHVNPQIENPHLIYPGDSIRLIYMDGKPRLTVQRTYKMSPGTDKLEPKVRSMPQEPAIPAIPLDAISNWMSKSRVVDPGVLEGSPYIVQTGAGRVIAGAGDDVYARGELPEDQAVFGIYRQGMVFKDPATKEVLGIEALDMGTGKLRATEGDVATLSITRSTEELRIGDRLIPQEERVINSTFYPSAPEAFEGGEIIMVEGGVNQVGKLSVVVLNKGAREGLEEGNILAIYKRGETVVDRIKKESVKLPDERAGLLMVFRAFDKVSYGLVLEADRPLKVTDLVRQP